MAVLLYLCNIDENGNTIGEDKERYETPEACKDRIDQILSNKPEAIYASEHLLRKHKLPISPYLELRGTTGWEIRGVFPIDKPKEAAEVAEYLGGMVDKETDNAKNGKKIRMSKTARKSLRNQLRTKWQ